MPTTSTCVVCKAASLRPYLSVAGDMGPAGLIPSTDRFGTALADIARCTSCGHMQLDPMPGAGSLAQAYADAASGEYIEEEAGQRETARRALERIERYQRDRGTLLDLGCWVGFLLAEAQQRGWRTTGVEPSDFASSYARDQLGLEVIKADLFSAELPKAGFDVVTMGDVIEHLTDPSSALGRIRELLKPAGILWLALPDAGSRLARTMGRRWWSVLPTHVQYFTRGSISKLLNGNGFQVLDISTAPKAFTVRYYLERIGGYAPRLTRGLVHTAGIIGLRDRIWAPDFRDRMAVIARLV